MATFCKRTGKYLLAPEKPVKYVSSLFVCKEQRSGLVYETEDVDTLVKCVYVRSLVQNGRAFVLESQNSVYVAFECSMV